MIRCIILICLSMFMLYATGNLVNPAYFYEFLAASVFAVFIATMCLFPEESFVIGKATAKAIARNW